MSALKRLVRAAGGMAATLLPARREISAVASESGARMPASFARAVPVLKRDPAERNVQWVFLGCPGVGKGTYASRLSQFLGVPHISTGDLVREELSSSGPLAGQVIRRNVTLIWAYEFRFFSGEKNPKTKQNKTSWRVDF